MLRGTPAPMTWPDGLYLSVWKVGPPEVRRPFGGPGQGDPGGGPVVGVQYIARAQLQGVPVSTTFTFAAVPSTGPAGAPYEINLAGNLGTAYTLATAGNKDVVLRGATLNANCTITLSGLLTSYQRITILAFQDATGGRTVSINDGTGAVPIAIPTASNAAVVVGIEWDGVDARVFVPGASAAAASLVWVTLPFVTADWDDFGSGWQTGQYAIDPFNVVHLRGLVKLKAGANMAFYGARSVIANLPVGARPALNELYEAHAFTSVDESFRLDMLSTGALTVAARVGNSATPAVVAGTFVSLSGITYAKA